MAFLEIENLHKSFGANIALHHFDMQIERGEFITFLGPSGCGKTTVLRMIAGFETPTRGIIRPEFIKELLDEKLAAHPGYYGEMIWILMMLEQWIQSHQPRLGRIA